MNATAGEDLAFMGLCIWFADPATLAALSDEG
jgi:hypothetical protein